MGHKMSEIKTVSLDDSHRPAVLEMISRVFTQDDPLARSQGIGEAEFRSLIDSLYLGFVEDGLSYVAIDEFTQTIAGVVLAEITMDRDHNEGSDAIAEIIEKARSCYYAEVAPDRESLAHIHFVASHPEFRQQGIVQILTQATLDAAREADCKRIFVEASGIRSKRLFADKMNFTERILIHYDTFEYEGRYPFKAIAGHDGLSLLDRRL